MVTRAYLYNRLLSCITQSFPNRLFYFCGAMLPAALRRRLEGSKNRKANGTEHPETRQREPETQNELKEQIIKKSLIKMTRN
jgi:hypothetical protein